MVDMSDLQALKLMGELHRQEAELVRLRGVALRDLVPAETLAKVQRIMDVKDAEIERLRAENQFLFEVIQNDALLVERYNAFRECRK